MRNKKVELLAPAGNAEAFYGAVHAGADAIYLGGNRFGARAYAENFSEDELVDCIRYAHLLGRKVYLTVNTLVKDILDPWVTSPRINTVLSRPIPSVAYNQVIFLKK